MKATFFKKAAALCSAAAMAVMGLSALSMTASADDGMTISGAKVQITQAQAAAGEWIAWELTMTGNTGYAAAGVKTEWDPELLTMRYDEELDDETLAYYEEGPAASGLTPYVNRNQERGISTYSVMGTRNNTEDGTIIVYNFKVPEDAQVGDVYDITVTVDSIFDRGSNDVAVASVDGYIEVIEETTESTTETTTTEETTTTTTETDATNTDAPNTDAPNTNTTDVPPAQTGDFGVGLVVAGLVAAAGAAVVLRKKED